MIHLNLPVAVFAIIARRFIDHCRPMHLVPLLLRHNNQLAITYNMMQPSILLGLTAGVIYIYRRYRKSSRRSVEHRPSFTSNYSPKRLGADIRGCARRPWCVKKFDPILTDNTHINNPPRTRLKSRRRFIYPSESKDFINTLAEEIDTTSISSNRKPATRNSHQSTMITDSLLTLNDSKQFPPASNHLTETTCLDIQKSDDPCRLQPVLNLSQNCIDLISNDGDSPMKPVPVTSNNSMGSSLLGATPKILMSDNDIDSIYTDRNLVELSREILYSNARPDDGDMSKIRQVSPLSSDMSIETYAKKPRRRRRGKLRFTSRKNRRVGNKNNITSVHRTRSGRVYNAARTTETNTASCKRPS